MICQACERGAIRRMTLGLSDLLEGVAVMAAIDIIYWFYAKDKPLLIAKRYVDTRASCVL
jgi:hypothetical protein